MADGLTLVVRIDGGPEQTITFAAADNTAAAVAAHINSVLVGGAAVVTGGQVQLRSDRQGTTSRVEVLPASTARDETGQQAGAAIGTGNVGNIDAVTAAEVVALLEDLDGGTATVEEGRVRITSGTRGGTSTVQIHATSTAAGLGFDNAVHGPGGKLPTGNDVPNPGQLFVVELDPDGRQRFVNRTTPLPGLAPSPDDTIAILTLSVLVNVDDERVDGYDTLGAHPDDRRYAGRILDAEDPEDENAVVWLDVDDAAALESAELLLAALRGSGPTGHAEVLGGGADGGVISPDDLLGREADPDNPDLKATGLEALGEYDDIAIVAAPDAATLSHPVVAAGYLIAHAERQRYRIAVVDGPPGASITQIRQFRGQFDSKYAALYYPWIQVLDPTERAAQGAPPRKLLLPASGFVAGIYARSDVERGVHKAPANEVVRGLTQFELNINKPRNDVLNPEGINALRFLEGRGNRVWGARTMSSDPEWRYVNVRRLFIYLEHSIDKGTQWAVFEPNNRRLWDNIRQTVEDFLLVMWRDGALLGDKPEDAYFVRCDRTTMTQNDLDNGRLICLVGVAPVKPAEFVIFRVGQWTAESKV
ncbi:MAG: phage tail sheath subtilisin-like domain-containing protein [Verrucomicrobiae bacterium]|nr:phage tail sheath subtilisin-like domain-containing protein [Verrucomicrobiae bacterium]